MSTLTGRIVAGLRADLAQEGHTDFAVSDDPTVDELAEACGVLHVPVHEFVARIEQEGCPSWCERHSLDVGTGELVHRRTVTHGHAEIDLELALADGPDVAVLLPEWPQATAESARDLAAALTDAVTLLDDEKGPQIVGTPGGDR